VRKLLLITLGALLLGAAAIWLMQQDQGYILISLGSVSVEMSFWLGAIIFVVASCILIWLLLFLRWLLAAGGVRQWWIARRANKQTSKTAKGLMDFLSGDWLSAGRILKQSVKDPELSKVSLLFAAKAAANNQQLEQAKQLLTEFSVEYPQYKDFASLQMAESLIQASQIDRAIEILEAIQSENKTSLRLMANIYVITSNWSALEALLPKIKRQSVPDENNFKALQVKTYCGLLTNIDPKLSAKVRIQKLEAIWSGIPRSLRQIAEIITAYSHGLATADAPEKALSLLTKALKSNWHPSLLQAYGQLEIKDGTKQLAIGEQWLATYSDDPQLLFALGGICRRMGFLGKAKDYMQSTIDIAPTVQAYHELAAVLELLGDTSSSSEVYRKGLRFATQSIVDKA
jgi:HemY protein